MPQRFEEFGAVTIASALSDFTITPTGAAAAIDPKEVRNGLGMAQVDQWTDGFVQQKRIDGVEVMVRRSGWRIELWGADEAEPAPDPLPAPPDAHDYSKPQAPVRLKIAPGFWEAQETKVPRPVEPAAPVPPTSPPPEEPAAPAFSLRGALRELGLVLFSGAVWRAVARLPSPVADMLAQRLKRLGF